MHVGAKYQLVSARKKAGKKAKEKSSSVSQVVSLAFTRMRVG